MDDITVLVGIVGGALGIGGAIWAVVTSYTTSRVKAFAAEQEFRQLQASLAKLSADIVALNKDQNQHSEEFKDLLRDIRYALTGARKIQTGEYLIRERREI